MSNNHIHIDQTRENTTPEYVYRLRIFSMGGALAMIMSWSLHHHIGWAILHGLFGWLYVLFYWLTLQ